MCSNNQNWGTTKFSVTATKLAIRKNETMKLAMGPFMRIVFGSITFKYSNYPS
jgi:hypothetical protein